MEDNWDGVISFFGTDNLEETHKFYNEILDLPLYKDQGVCRIYTVPGGGKIGFCSHMAVTHQGKSPIITLLTDDVDGVYDRLLKADYDIPEPPTENKQFKIYHFFMSDPNGYTVEIQRFLD